MQSNTLQDKLHHFDFEDSSASGLLFTDRDYRNDPHVSFDERLVLKEAEELQASAVYFRRVEGRSSIPQLFIYDNSHGKYSHDDFINIHRKLSSSGIVPLYYVFDNVEVKIYDCRKTLKRSGNNLKRESFDCLHLATEAHEKFKKYSAHLFRNGSFWELKENKNRFTARTSGHKKLIDNLKRLRDDFSKDQENVTACNKLIVLSILIKYLEERKDSKGTHALPKSYFMKFGGAKSFCEVLQRGMALDLFEDLGTTINGSIFRLDEKEKLNISKLDQVKLADFLDANLELDKQQYVLWPLYDFNYLPVELISRIYEEFIPNRKDIAYTPPCLVDFMIDECMPIDKPQKDFKVIDVSCGSGIFMVGAFKRIVRWKQYNQFQETGEIKSPKLRTLKPLLRDSIFGIDIEPEAVRLAIFSLTIAVCDMLDPTKMWEELTQEKFLDLSENVIQSDFFDFVNTHEKYDLVIGNPPFNTPKKTREGKDRYWNAVKKKAGFEIDIPYKNIALAFLLQAMKLLKKDGLLSLVMPSGPLLYRDTLKYREYFFNKYNVPQIADFTSLQTVLFDTRNVSVSIIFAQKKEPDNKNILHIVIKRTITSKEKLFFEIDKYDLHYVSKELAKIDTLIWKTNLLGSGYLYTFIKNLQKYEPLKRFLINKKKKFGWEYGTGYFVGESKNGSKIDLKKRKPAKHLTGHTMIPTDKFINDTIDENDIKIETETLFEGRREGKKKIFKGPHILIKTNIDLPIVLYKKDLIFRRDITGIHAPFEEINELVKLESVLKKYRSIYKAMLMLKSGKLGISRATVIKNEDLLNLPFPGTNSKLQISNAEKITINDLLEYGFEQLSKGENAKINIEEAKKKDLDSFGKTFCAALNSIYGEDLKEFYPLEPIQSLSYICTPFVYGNPDRPEKISEKERRQIEEGDLSSLMENKEKESVYYKRIIKQYRQDRNMVFLIKPKFLRYWLRSIALRDANEVFTDLVSSGY